MVPIYLINPQLGKFQISPVSVVNYTRTKYQYAHLKLRSKLGNVKCIVIHPYSSYKITLPIKKGS